MNFYIWSLSTDMWVAEEGHADNLSDALLFSQFEATKYNMTHNAFLIDSIPVPEHMAELMQMANDFKLRSEE